MYDILLVCHCIALSCTIYELFELNNTVTLKSGLEIWCHSKAWVRFPIRLL